MSDFLDHPRRVTSEWHFMQARKWLAFDGDRQLDNTLVYAAFEVRLAIERYFFELAFLLKGCELTEEEEKRCRSWSGIAALIKETDKSYRQTIEFTKIISSVVPRVPKVTTVDTAFLRRRWQELSEFCHKQLRPDETFDSPNRSFQQEGFRVIKETIERFSEWPDIGNLGIISRASMPGEVQNLYDRFAKGEIDTDQARLSLKLMAPVLEQRFALRSSV